MKPRILIVHTGGTIGMETTPDGLRPMAQFAAVLRQWLPEAQGPAPMPEIDIVELATLFDSADLTPAHWLRIAGDLAHHWHAYDGFVVLHGTDTMAWTASALSFLLQGADKPVILTGSQVPLAVAGSDAPDNLRMALALASDPRLCEVGICFGHELLRGNRASKIATRSFHAFASNNYPPLAKWEGGLRVYEERLLPAREKSFFIPERIDPQAVAALTVYPGLSAAMVEAVLAVPGVKALVLRSYGLGNMPMADVRLLDVMAAATARGVVIVNITQCPFGAVAQDIYATGAAYARLGVMAGGDMTLEAACTKLHLFMARGLTGEQIRAQIAQPLQGEISATDCQH